MTKRDSRDLYQFGSPRETPFREHRRMRRRELLQGTAQDVCFFCACRLAGRDQEPPRAPFTTHRRTKQTATPVRRQEAALTSESTQHDTSNVSTIYRDRSSAQKGLSPAELQEIQYLEQLTHKTANKDKSRNVQQVTQQRTLRQPATTSSAAQSAPSDAKPLRTNRDPREYTTMRLTLRQGMLKQDGKYDSTSPSAKGSIDDSMPNLVRRIGGNKRVRSSRETSAQESSAGPRQRRKETIEKVSMPAFLKSPQQVDDEQSTTRGWGTGPPGITPVQYGERELQEAPEQSRPLIRTHSMESKESQHTNFGVGPVVQDTAMLSGNQRRLHREEDKARRTDEADAQYTARNSVDSGGATGLPQHMPSLTRKDPDGASSLFDGLTTTLQTEDKTGFGLGARSNESPVDGPEVSPIARFRPVLPRYPVSADRSRIQRTEPSDQSHMSESDMYNDRSHNVLTDSISKTGYQARLIDEREANKFRPVVAIPKDNWRHFQPKEKPVAETQDQNELPRQTSQHDIDSIFENYRKARDLKNQQYTQATRLAANTSPHPTPHSTRDVTQQKCARCGGLGHVARLCPQNGDRWSMGRPQHGSRSSDERIEQPRERSTAGTYQPSVHRVKLDSMQSTDQPSDRSQSVPPSQSRFNEPESEEHQPRLSSYDEAVERTMRSRRFSDAPARKERPVRRRRRDDEDDVDSAYEDEIDPNALAAREARKRQKQAKREQEKREQREAAQRNRADAKQINLPEYISVSNLAQAMGTHYDDFIVKLDDLGYDDVFPGKVLNSETSALIAMEYGFEPIFASETNKESSRDLHAQPPPQEMDLMYLPSRPPVVTIMGHVDHGKTTILDYMRKASVAAGEAGGITQHIGAFSVNLEATGRTITFLDTPGHAAFLAMRQRGANVTDIVVLVVAADDSVKPQTLEALKHARAANVPIIVAINKVDKPEADVQRVKNDLGRHGIDIEDYGGETQVIEVSGKTGQGMTDLEEAIVTQSEVLDHRADTEGVVEGWVLEATTKASGRVATVLVRRGTLKIGTIIVAGRTWARVRSLRNDTGQSVREATPGTPVEVDGWRDQPMAGDEVLQAETEQKATSVVEYRIELEERKKMAQDTEAINAARMLDQDKHGVESNPSEHDHKQSSGPIQVPFIIKADVSGSAEAIAAYILGVSSPMIVPQVLYSQVGQINENDIELASVAQGVIISFNLPADEGMKGSAAARGVRVLEHNIIYRVLDDIKELFADKLPPIITQKVLGEADVSMAFDIGVGGRKTMKIAGCKIRNGVIGKTSRVRVMRGGEKVYDGTLSSLKNGKKDVTEMRKGTECGLAFDDWQDFQVDDVVQTYQEISEKRSL